MEIDVERLTPGMILKEDILGKSGKPIVPKNTKLTDEHILFIKRFLIEKVSVSPLYPNTNDQIKSVKNELVTNQENQVFLEKFEHSIRLYKDIFQQVKNNMVLEMFQIRETWIPKFHEVVSQPIEMILNLLDNSSKEDIFYAKNVAMTFLALALSVKLGYEKKDWLQIGFAALLCDLGIAKVDKDLHSLKDENWRLHPIYSYKLIEKEVTLNKQAKLAILQHHEYLDGTGFPAHTEKEKIHPYAQIIAVSDFVITEYEQNSLSHVITLLNKYKGIKFLENIVITMIKELRKDS